MAGTLIPQEYQVVRYVAQHPEARRRMELLHALGLTHVYSAWWFVALLCVLAASLLVCTWRRSRALRTAAGPGRTRALGSLLTHAGLLLILAGGAVRATWGEKGMLALREGEAAEAFQGPRGEVRLPFAVRLVDFDVQWHEPDGPVKDYRSTLQILKRGAVAVEKTIEVNAPLSFEGYTLYQFGYDPADPAWTSLQVVRDPGVAVVYAGFASMTIGLALVFWIPPAAGPRRKDA